MSWLAKSLVNTLRADLGNSSDDDDEAPSRPNRDDGRSEEQDEGEEQQPGTPTRGVKEDLSELTQTLTRQFWGVASFLAPPPPTQDPSPPPPPDSSDHAAVDDDLPTLAAIRSDLADIGGRVRSGISVLSSNRAVTEISKIASNFFGSEEGDEYEEGESVEKAGAGGVGVTEEAVGFVRNVSMHPETWLDFPLLPGHGDSDDFHMSDAQEEHALAIERLAPRLAALRIELCPSHMSEGCFWKIYFVLLHPKLNKHDAELLSTPQILHARAMLLQDMTIRTRPNSDNPGLDLSSGEEVAALVPPVENAGSPPEIPDVPAPTEPHTPEKSTTYTFMPSTEFETDKHPIQTTEDTIVEKSVIEEEPTVHAKSKDSASESTLKYEEDGGDDWLEEESAETGVSRGATVPLGNDEDVSFSDLEVDDDDDGGEGMHSRSKSKARSIGSPTKESDWVPVRSGNSSSRQTRGSNDWLDVDMDAV